MKFLMEHEMAFDDDEIGFPSIQGCHAIVYQTGAGLFGYHNAGGSGDDRFKPRAVKFSEFIRSLDGFSSPGSRLYGCSFIGNNERGYSGVATAKWKLELVTFATELNYTGKISGYDLHKTFTQKESAYVEYRRKGAKCDVHIRAWDRKEHPATKTNPDRSAHKSLLAKGFDLSLVDVQNVVSDVGRSNLIKISKEKLR